MEPRSHKEHRTGYGQIAMATGLLLGCVWSAPLYAAANAAPDCDRLARGLKNLETPAEVLDVTAVDHASPADDALSSNDTAELVISTAESPTPFLYLSPRVASLSRNVFEAGRAAMSPNHTPSALPSSPVAERDESADTREDIEDVSPQVSDQRLDLPLFQREMYRTDI